MSEAKISKYDTLKQIEHEKLYQLTRIADSLEKIANPPCEWDCYQYKPTNKGEGEQS